nr:GIY-YIG nuclease family protein [Nitrosomonas nitrosa]
MAKTFTEEDDELLSELGVEVETARPSSRTPREERIIAGFEEIQRFVDEHGRLPQHGEDRDIFERLYAVRLDRIRALDECRNLVAPMDRQGLLKGTEVDTATDNLDDDALLEALGVESDETGITELRHVRSTAEKESPDEIAERVPCPDFEKFRPLFLAVQADLDAGIREARAFGRDTEIAPGQFFILGGQKAYIQSLGPEFETKEGRTNRRMRVIFDNGVETNALLRSFQRALYKEENFGRRITDPNIGPLFGDHANDADLASGLIYVLRSKSTDPKIARYRTVLHKIGVTGGDLKARLANAAKDPTFLMADVEIVATYQLFNINRTRLENLIHRIFGSAQLNVEIIDRFGKPIVPREWFLAPLAAIDEAIARIKDGTIAQYEYDSAQACLIKQGGSSERARQK